MAYNFLRAERDQSFLLPPDLRDWLPEGHLAWFILDVVDQLDLRPFYRQHRDDGHGHPAYDPKLLLGVLLYGYCLGLRSSRQLERRCSEDIAFRVLAANQTPDHVTIARFRVRHQQALAGFLVQSLKLCAAAGLVRLGVVALDGTKVAANAANTASHTLDKLEREVAEILRQAAEIDQREDLEHGQARGDELPEALASKAGRLARLRQAKALLEAEAAERQRRYEQRVAELAAAARARGKQPRAHIKPRRRDEAPNPKATANVTDPDSRFMHTRRGSVQGYNAQAVTTLEQVIVAAELIQQANDLQQLDPMLVATTATLGAAGIAQRPGRLLADSGYWTIANLTQLPDAPELLIPPARHGRQGKPRKDGKPTASKSDGLRAAMTAKLASEDGKACYAKRKETIEPVFGQLKEQQGARRFLRRGWPPAMPSGSCCAAPTTSSSSCGGTRPGHRRPGRRPPDPRPRTGWNKHGERRPPAGRGSRGAAQTREVADDLVTPPLGNRLLKVNVLVGLGSLGGLPHPSAGGAGPVAQLGRNAHGEVLEPGRVPDCYLGLRLDPSRKTEPAGVLVVAPASLLHPCVPQPDGTVLYELVTGHPDRTPRELVFVADLTVELRAWPTDTWTKVGIDPQAAAAAVVAGWRRGDLLGLRLGGLTAEEALALERPAMTYVRGQLGDRLQRQLARAYRRWRHQTSGHLSGDRLL